MWKEYRKRFLLTQIVIAIVVVLGVARWHLPTAQLVLAFVVMEIGGVIGSWFAARLKRNLDDREQKLPLKPKS